MTDDDIRTLLADLGWLRTLARRLVRDANVADDLVQEACAIALRQKEPPQQWRAWLTGVVRNLFHAQHREREIERRRDERLRAAVEAEDTRAVVQRAEAQQRLAAVVLQLDEPYRATVLLRFFEGLPPRKIAQRHGVPVATVHSRLQRAMQQLRERLDVERRGPETWLAVVAPVAWPHAAPPTAFAARTGQAFAAAGIVAVAASFVWLAWPRASAPRDGDVVMANVPSSPEPPRASSTPFVVADERSADAPAAAAANAEPPGRSVRGRVVDLQGNGVPGVTVFAKSGDFWATPRATMGEPRAIATTDANGAFRGTIDGDAALVFVHEARAETVYHGAWRGAAAADPLVVAAPATGAAGSVVDEDGLPVPNGRVTVEWPSAVLANVALSLDGTARTLHELDIGVDGTFDLQALAAVPGAVMVFTADGLPRFTMPLPERRTTSLRVVMPAARPGAADLSGDVLHADGTPAAGALVALGVTAVLTDRRGRFVISLPRAGRPTDLVAAAPGRAPARVPLPVGGGGAVADWPRPLELRLGGPTRSVRGVVRDENGPIAGAMVWIDDPTPLGVVGAMPVQLEYFVGGGPLRIRGRWLSSFAEATSDEPVRDDRRVQGLSLHEDEPTATWRYVVTAADGTFELPGLLDRAYTLRAFDPRTRRSVVARDVTHVSRPELVTTHDTTTLHARVVAPNGDPIVGVKVAHSAIVFERDTRTAAGLFALQLLHDGSPVTSGADGTFALEGIGDDDRWMLLFSGEHVRPGYFDGRDIDPFDARTFVIERRWNVRIELADPREADEATFENAMGEAETVLAGFANLHDNPLRLPLQEGRCRPFAIGERTVRCVLWRGGQRGREIAIVPTPGGTTLLQ